MNQQVISRMLLLCTSLICVVHGRLASQQSADEVYNAVLKKYGSITSLRLNFTSQPSATTTLTGTIKAKKGNKFVLDLGDRVLVSNGQSLWNYSKLPNSVVVSKYEDKGQISVEKVFFTFLKTYKGSAVFAEQSSKGQKLTILRLLPPTPDGKISGVKSIELGLSPKKLEVLRMSITDDTSTQQWTISDMKVNIKIPDSAFVFSPSKDTKIIDMR